MVQVVVSYPKTEKQTDAISLKEALLRRNIAFEEKREGNTIVISIKATKQNNGSRLH